MKIILKWAVTIGQMKCLRNWTNNDYSAWFLWFCAIIEMIDDQIDLDLNRFRFTSLLNNIFSLINIINEVNVLTIIFYYS